jgi:hypothetical protein
VKVCTHPPSSKRPSCDEGAAICDEGTTDTAERVSQKPDAVARGVLGWLIPQARNEGESGADSALECAEEDSKDAEADEVASSAVTAEDHGPYDAIAGSDLHWQK